MTNTVAFRMELGSKIRAGRCVGNVYLARGVERFADGCVRTWTVSEHSTEDAARAAVASLNAEGR